MNDNNDYSLSHDYVNYDDVDGDDDDDDDDGDNDDDDDGQVCLVGEEGEF